MNRSQGRRPGWARWLVVLGLCGLAGRAVASQVPSAIVGLVEDTAGNPLGGWTVNLYQDEEELRSTTTDAEGGYQFAWLPAGTYEVEVESAQGYEQLAATSITLAAGNCKWLAWRIPPTGGTGATNLALVWGRVTDGQGYAMDDWTVNLLVGETVVASSTTDDLGMYWFCFVPAGVYDVEVEVGQGYAEEDPVAVAVSSGDVAEASFEVTGTGHGIALKCAVWGVVIDDKGAAKAGWTVSLTQGQTITTVTDENGLYMFPKVPHGEYDVEVTIPEELEEVYTLDPYIKEVEVDPGEAAQCDFEPDDVTYEEEEDPDLEPGEEDEDGFMVVCAYAENHDITTSVGYGTQPEVQLLPGEVWQPECCWYVIDCYYSETAEGPWEECNGDATECPFPYDGHSQTHLGSYGPTWTTVFPRPGYYRFKFHGRSWWGLNPESPEREGPTVWDGDEVVTTELKYHAIECPCYPAPTP